MSRRAGAKEPGKAGHSGPLSQAGIATWAMEAPEPQPWIQVLVGRDRRSWGVSVTVAGGNETTGFLARGEVLLDARWMREPTDLAMVCLWAQSALRKVAIDRGWPIP